MGLCLECRRDAGFRATLRIYEGILTPSLIEEFNKLPKEARPMALEGMREVWTRKPEAAEKITQQLEQAEEQSLDKGISR
jgi:hypothetical protein